MGLSGESALHYAPLILAATQPPTKEQAMSTSDRPSKNYLGALLDGADWTHGKAAGGASVLACGGWQAGLRQVKGLMGFIDDFCHVGWGFP